LTGVEGAAVVDAEDEVEGEEVPLGDTETEAVAVAELV
jgi:hypothetical protein